MREALLTDLVADVLGPRSGIREVLKGKPLSEYVTGILSPAGGETVGDDSGVGDSEMGEDSGSFDDDSEDPGIHPTPSLSPILNPYKMPPAMGMTFYVEFGGRLRLDVCATWARYINSESGWVRFPRHAVFSIGDNDGIVWLGGDGGPAEEEDAEVSVHTRCRMNGERATVSIHMVNRMSPSEERGERDETHVFQPQIRVVCRDGARVVPHSSGGAATEEEREFEVLYADKKALGRGHMTSVVWREIDPEIMSDGAGVDVDYPERLGRPGFAWIDGEALPERDRERFSLADIRTEFVPLHQVSAPDMDHWPEGSKKPRLEAEFYSEQYDPARLRAALKPFDVAYTAWVDKLCGSSVGDDEVRSKIVEKAEDAHRRIRGGIDFLCGDGDARLAFCFACRAMDRQSVWSKSQKFTFRPFQLGFVLLSAESALKPNSRDRKVCDLLWVPTGAGKTEAYLFLVAMTAAYRRLRAQERRAGDRSGAGVSVISRYTLRLLTIQQFRRALSLFVAMEYLRVAGLKGGSRVGWRPRNFSDDRDFLWGTARFSVGLWVGVGVTPNKLDDHGYPRKRGAISMLENPDESETSEPAQIFNCPACDAILSLPRDNGPRGEIKLHYIVKVTGGDGAASGMVEHVDTGMPDPRRVKITMARNRGSFFALTAEFEASSPLTHERLSSLCDRIRECAGARQVKFEYMSVRSRPGYFIKRYGNKNVKYDFEIFCPNDECDLKIPWAAGAPMGNANGSKYGLEMLTDTIRGMTSPDNNKFVDANPAFELDQCVSDRIPIPAFTVDDQVYANLPTMLVATVDKFARLPFEARSAQLFGNVDHHHHIRGYYRLAADGDHPAPSKRKPKNYASVERGLVPPDMIIQDELHLLDGSLGSMVGIYETAIEHLASTRHPIKYVASTATIRRANSHVRAIFSRDMTIFPPQGLSANDRFFVTERSASPLLEDRPGRLHVGICAPGKGSLTPLVHIWARLACSLNDRMGDQHIDEYWTVTGYFNTVRELASARSLYRQNIPERIDHIAGRGGGGPRTFGDDRSIELSGRTPSTSLPAYLKWLEGASSGTGPDALFTTSMFGTGVDVSKIGTMIVNGQPKTSSSYIQATGRVGRKRGALVVTFYLANRPRDLNHYELFSRYHMQLHRFVEPPTAFPFAAGVMENALGPVMVAILRNGRRLDRWAPKKDGAQIMKSGSDSDEIKSIQDLVQTRAERQPSTKRPAKDGVERMLNNRVDLWREAAAGQPDLEYYEYGGAKNNVVLGDPLHASKDKSPVYCNVPSSMRDVEEETEFEA